MIRCEDWRNAPPQALERCYQRERARWIAALQWDVAPTHRLLEGARLTGQAAGILARDAQDRPIGWTYYLLNQRTLQIGGLVAETGEVTRALLDAVLRSPEADMATELRCFAFPSSNALESALTRQRFAIRRHLYLSRPLVPSTFAVPAGRAACDGAIQPPPRGPWASTGREAAPPLTPHQRVVQEPVRQQRARQEPIVRAPIVREPGSHGASAQAAAAGGPVGQEPWRLQSRLSITHWVEDEAVPTVRLMARAYAGVASASCFAPRGRLDEWGSYLAQIVKLAGVGHFVPRLSLRATLPGETDLAGVLLATDLGAGAAHIAQLVTDPAVRRRGLGRDLIETCCALASAAGFRQMTLIVAEDNAPARALYAAAGFQPVAHFVHAVRSAPTRVRAPRPVAATPRPAAPARRPQARV